MSGAEARTRIHSYYITERNKTMSNDQNLAMSDSTQSIIKPDPDPEVTTSELSTMNPSSGASLDTPGHGVDLVFEHFKKFPREVRDMIWSLAAYEPRVVEVTLAPPYEVVDGPSYRSLLLTKWLYRLEYKTLVPALMHTCHESRAAGEKIYERLPAPEYSRFGDSYVNWDRDVIVLVDNSDEGLLIKFLNPQMNWHGGRQLIGYQGLKDKCTKLGLAGRTQASHFARFYLPSESLKNLQEIVLIPSQLRLPRSGNITLTNVGKLTVDMKSRRHRIQSMALLSDSLKDSVTTKYAVRDRRKLLKRAEVYCEDGKAKVRISNP